MRDDRATPDARRLSNGRYTTRITAAGGGYSALGRLALTRWTNDPTLDADGIFVYLRDLEGGAYWSATYQPVRRPAERYAVRFAPGIAEFAREDDGIELRLALCVAPDHDAELRRCTIVNRSGRARRLELTTYAEAVLNTPAADAAHPAFSKLFVQTEYDAGRGLLLARHRLRSPDDEPLCLAHRLWREGADHGSGGTMFETDRARFIGRGRTLAWPAALDAGARLSDTVGNVLDPVLSLRLTVALAPGERATVVALLAAAGSREEVNDVASRYAGAGAARAMLRAAGLAADDVEPRLPAAVLSPCFLPPSSAVPAPERLQGPLAALTEPLRFFNGHGGFSADGSEYVVRLPVGPAGPERPPQPWSNVVANERAGFIATESGAGYTWSVNSRENRLTPWRNDPVVDPHGEALYLRDEATGAYWSPTPGPRPAAAPYEVRHGFGYTGYRLTSDGLEQEVVQFMPRHDPVKIVRLRVTNHGRQSRRLSAFFYAQWVLGVAPTPSGGGGVTTTLDGDAVLAENASNGEFAHLVAFAAAVPPHESAAVHSTTSRRDFLGAYGSVHAPAALCSAAALDGTMGPEFDPCAAFQVALAVAPGETVECAFLLGQGESREEARALVARYGEAGAVARALDEARAYWRDLLAGVQVTTPVPELDAVVNGWLSYQNLSCRMLGRSAYYQSGGAFGFCDQLQDAAALVHLAPEITRRQIVLHAAHQFVEGDVLHWWHPPTSKGIRTRFSDDLLWLPLVAAYCLRTTGDDTVLDELARFVTARAVEPGEDEAFVVPDDSSEHAPVYEHCCRAIDRSLTRGAHGLPLMGGGDWNDGMNRVGREGRGESVWLGFLLYRILGSWAPLCERRGDSARATRYRAFGRELRTALDSGGWDGGWYRRAYYDDGASLGSAANDECRIDTIAQAWAVISGAAPEDRARQALDAMEEQLVSEPEGIIRLLTPAFDQTPHDPGYIKGYLPGVRENGGQYTHAALWAVQALALDGRRDRAARLLGMLSPVTRALTEAAVATYQVEPYVVAADVYGVAPHVGRGGWSWYTGSAGWMFRVALESVLGLELHDGRTLVLRPCVPDEWPGFTIRYRLADRRTVYEIVGERGGERGAPARAWLEGEDDGGVHVEDGAVRIPLAFDGGVHRVRVTLGDDLGPRYEAVAL